MNSFHGHVAFLTTVGALAIEYEWSIGVVALIFSGIPLSARGAAGSGMAESGIEPT